MEEEKGRATTSPRGGASAQLSAVGAKEEGEEEAVLGRLREGIAGGGRPGIAFAVVGMIASSNRMTTRRGRA